MSILVYELSYWYSKDEEHQIRNSDYSSCVIEWNIIFPLHKRRHVLQQWLDGKFVHERDDKYQPKLAFELSHCCETEFSPLHRFSSDLLELRINRVRNSVFPSSISGSVHTLFE